jgi:hypothetical protein
MRLGFIHVIIRIRLPSAYRHFYRNVASRPIIMEIKCAYYIVGANEGIENRLSKLLINEGGQGFVLLLIDQSIDGLCLLLL